MDRGQDRRARNDSHRGRREVETDRNNQADAWTMNLSRSEPDSLGNTGRCEKLVTGGARNAVMHRKQLSRPHRPSIFDGYRASGPTKLARPGYENPVCVGRKEIDADTAELLQDKVFGSESLCNAQLLPRASPRRVQGGEEERGRQRTRPKTRSMTKTQSSMAQAPRSLRTAGRIDAATPLRNRQQDPLPNYTREP
jgi:hypothetical protein